MDTAHRLGGGGCQRYAPGIRSQQGESHAPLRPLAVLAATLLHGSLVQAAEPLAIDVHRDANCGCCKDWIKHLEANGFKVTDHVEADMSAVKSRLGVPYSMGSCHTR